MIVSYLLFDQLSHECHKSYFTFRYHRIRVSNEHMIFYNYTTSTHETLLRKIVDIIIAKINLILYYIFASLIKIVNLFYRFVYKFLIPTNIVCTPSRCR